jgi:prohibitin 2
VANQVRRWLRDWRQRHPVLFVVLILGVLLLVFLTVYLRDRIFIAIDSGEVGVQWSRFRGGTITARVYDEGLHVIVPWNTMNKYNLRFQIVAQTFKVLSAEGLEIEVETTVRFRPVPESMPFIHKHAGPDYVDVLLVPEMASIVREVIAKHTYHELYFEKRLDIAKLITKKLRRRMGITPQEQKRVAAVDDDDDDDDDTDDKKDPEKKARKKAAKAFPKDKDEDWLHIEGILLANIALPESLAGAIEEKLRQEQLMLEHDYVVQKEDKEDERRIIESQGIAEFYRITGGLSILKWKGLDATLSLASSPNAKLVIIGGGEAGGLPLILGPLSGGNPPVPPPVPAAVPPP